MFFSSDIFSWMFFVILGFISLVLVLVIIFIIMALVKGGRQWNRNNHSPRLTVSAVVISKRTKMDMHRHIENIHSTVYTIYFVTFQFDSGDRLELHVPGREYGMMAEGDVGDLTFQGTRYLGFDRHTAGAVSEAGPVTAEDVPPRYTEKKSWDPEL